MRFSTTLLLLCIPFSALAEADNITRREGFMMLWESINRPAYETYAEYTDVTEDQLGYEEISYGKRRGILPDEDFFYPDQVLTMHDALLWLYRTRNIRELPDMQEEDLVSMINDYPVIEMNRSLEDTLSRADLVELIRTLDKTLIAEVHEVSFYADDFHGRGTAFGETFDMHAITAAHRSYPHNTLVKVTNVENGESVVVRINDRGPYVHGRDMDLSKASFEQISHTGAGVIRATFERLGDPELIDRCEQKERVYQKRIVGDVHFFRGVPHTFGQHDQLILQSVRPFVVLGITFPDGQYLRIQDFVLPKEKYRFTPDIEGRYVFHIGDTLGGLREMRMQVTGCTLPEAI